MYLESARRDLQNDVKILIEKLLFLLDLKKIAFFYWFLFGFFYFVKIFY
jgi:hypothetical protein